MLELTKKQTTPKYVDIRLRVPTRDAASVLNATREFLKLAGHEVREMNDESQELHPASEVFPDSHPGAILRGLRVREGMTQLRLAEKAGLRPHHISEMEHGKRPIGKEVAKRLARALGTDYKVLL
jgi:DNA-binding XRE family transcriptional regulator